MVDKLYMMIYNNIEGDNVVRHYKNSDQEDFEQEYYCVMVADIKDSRTGNQERWADLTKLLERIRTSLNILFTRNMEKEVVFTSGDSIQGVFFHIQEAYLYGRLLQKLFSPEKIRIGFGVGKVFSALEDKNSNYSTGQAFIEANEALWWAKYLDYDFYILPQSKKSMDINLIVELVSSIKALQTDYQKDLELMVECIYGFYNGYCSSPHVEMKCVLNYKNTLETFNNTINKEARISRIDTFLKNWDNEFSDFLNAILLNLDGMDYSQIGKYVNPQGIQSDIALLTESKRQTISKMYNSARIESIRKYEAVIYKKIGEFYDDYTIL